MNGYWAVFLLPAAGAIILFLTRKNRVIGPVLMASALIHFAAVAYLLSTGYDPAAGSWICPDPPGKLFLAITSGLFLATAGYTTGFLRRDREKHPRRNDTNYAGCLLLFLSSMSLACTSGHLGLYWVAIEATTLASAPLITLHHTPRSLEAVWKYLLICSAGIAIALLGIFFLATAAGEGAGDMTIQGLLGNAGSMDLVWLKASFILLLVGFGTKTGLAPVHTWLPDAHSEAPSMVSALLSGALLNCAFLGILRGHSICAAAGMGDFSGGLLMIFGILSMLTAGVFMIRQTDYKRMLAYSSIEHMGIIALGTGAGGLAAAGAMLHTVTHSAAKGLLFLTAGKLVWMYDTKKISAVRGIMSFDPVTGVFWLGGILAVAGTPPFGVFMSEFIVLKGLLEKQQPLSVVLYLISLAFVFVAMTRLVIPMSFGRPSGNRQRPEAGKGERSILGPAALALTLLTAGLFIPASLWKVFTRIAAFMGGSGL